MKKHLLLIVAILLWIISWNLPENFYIVKGILCILGFFAVILYGDYDPDNEIPTGF